MDLYFKTGTQEKYDSMAVHDEGTFYFTGDNVYLGDIKLSNGDDLNTALESIASNTEAIGALEDKIGNLEELDTTAKDDIVSAINEVFTAIGTGGTEAVVTIEESSPDDYAKAYTVYQGGKQIGIINIPKDLVVESGDVEINPPDHPEGTYIVLTLANADDQKIYIDAADLVDIYTAAEDATQVQLAITGTEISATLVAGGVGTTELADNAVTTEKLATDIQEDLDLAKTAVQSVTDGILNGTIMVDDRSVAVAGLGSAAYEDATAFDEAGAADTALQNAKEYIDSLLTWTEL